MQQDARVIVITPEELRELVATSVRRAVSEALRDVRDGNGKHVMTEAEAAAYLGFAPNTLRQWRAEGVGPRYSKPAGSAVRYSRKALDEWLDRGTLATAAHSLRG